MIVKYNTLKIITIYTILIVCASLTMIACENPEKPTINTAAKDSKHGPFTITFDTENVKIPKQIRKGGANATKPPQPELASFDWYMDKERTTLFDFTAKITEDITLYAGWSKNKDKDKKKEQVSYTVTFDLKGGKANDGSDNIPDKTVISGHKVVPKPKLPTKDGVTFGEWYKDMELKIPFFFDTDTITTDTTLYAKWNKPGEFSVRFNPDGGSGIESLTIKESDAVVEPLTAPRKEEYEFVDWYEDKERTKPFDFTSEMITEDTIVYAGWGHTVTFRLMGGEANDTTKPQKTLSGKLVTRPATDPKRVGYTFVDWYKDSLFATRFNFDTETITEDTTIYAGWGYTVTFDLKGGKANDTTKPQKVLSKGTVTRPDSNPTKKDKAIFHRWYTNNTLATAFNFTTEITTDTTLYAGWNVTVTFDTDGGSNIANQTIKEGAKAIQPVDAPTKAGYSFVGWHKDNPPTTLFDFDALINTHTTLYAGWKQLSYTIKFELDGGKANDGTPNIDEKTVFSGNTVTRPANPKKDKATFVDWYKESTLTTAFNFATLINKPTTLYAGWRYTVTFELDGGAPNIDEKTVLSGGTVTRPDVDPKKDKATFVDWHKDEALNTVFDFATETITESTTIYAKWNQLSYTVTFELDGGIPDIAVKTVPSGGTVTRPVVAPKKAGYEFVDWHKESPPATLFDFGTETITEDTPIYAKWEQLSYIVTFDLKGGKVNASIRNQPIPSGDPVTRPVVDPEKAGYEFVDWYKDSLFATRFDFDTETITEDTTIYAKWNQLSYTVTFDTNGGSDIDEKMIPSGNTVAKPTPNPTKNKAIFNLWYEDSTLITLFSFITKINKNITLYAGWNATVTFDTDGGSNIANQTIKEGAKAIKPVDAPIKKGYKFDGWYEDSALTSAFNFGTLINTHTTIYAKWVQLSYTVKFELDGGTPNIADEMVLSGNPVPKPADPKKDKAMFFDWYKDEVLTPATLFDFATLINKHTIIYAGWRYTVTFDLDKGRGITKSREILSGNSVRRPVFKPFKRGYKFVNWYKDSGLTTEFDFKTETIIQSITIYSKWNQSSYTVKFNLNGGFPKIASKTIKENATVTKPNVPNKAGFTFVDWYTDRNLDTLFDFNTEIIKDTTIYAGWNVTVRFNTKGGIPNIASQTIKEGDTAAKPAAPKKDKATFDDWYTDGALTSPFSFVTPVTKNITLYAGWNVTVTFDTKGGIPNIDSQTIKEGDTAAKPAAPKKDKATFDDWYTDGALTSPFSFVTPITKNITLYAGWNVTVTFDTDGGTNIADKTVLSGNPVSKPADPKKDKATVGLWHTDKSLETLFDFTTPITEDTTLYAGWRYTVTFDTDGGSNIANQTIKEGAKAIKPVDAPNKAGYEFVDWYKDSLFATRFDFTTETITESITIYAKWNRLKYIVTFELDGGKANDGTPNIADEMVFSGITVTKPKDPKKDKATFDSWYTDNTRATAFDFATPITEDTIIYAGWNVTVTFDVNGGSNIASQTIKEGAIAAKPVDPKKDEATFDDWYKDSGLTKEFDFVTPITESITLYAGWNVTVTFDTKGGSNIASQTIKEGDTAAQPKSSLTKKNKATFDDWYTDEALTSPFSFATPITEDTTLYAGWNVTVTFDTKGGSNIASQTIKEGDTAAQPKPSLTKKNKATFDDWYKDSGLTKAFIFATPITEDTTLYAGWNVTVTFALNGGKANNGTPNIASKTIKEGATVTQPKDPNKAGYTFFGWYKDSAFNLVFDFTTETIAESITIYAKWEQLSYTVTFDLDGGKANDDTKPQKILSGNTATIPATAPKKNKATFDDWYTDEKLTKAFIFATLITEDTTLYAGWNVTVRFDTDGGSNIASQTIKEGDTATQPKSSLTKKNKAMFDDWYKDSGLTKEFDFVTPITKNITLYAGWNVTVTFALNGGSNIASQTIKEGDTAAQPKSSLTKKDKATFDDWYTDEALTRPFSFVTPITKNITLYAGWNVTVTFALNGGKANNGTPNIASKTIKEGATVTQPKDPNKAGYTFFGWYKDSAFNLVFDFTTETIAESITIYAKWEQLSYTVTFDVNDGTPNIASQTVKEGAIVTQPKPSPTKKDKATFDNWYTDKALTRPFIFATPITEDTTLYAGWNVTVTFALNGGSNIASKTIKEGAIAIKPAAPNKAGATFDDWYTDSRLTTAKDFATPIAEDTTLYAGWNVTVTFDTNGGSNIADKTVLSGNTITAPAAPNKAGYAFGDWYTDSALTKVFRFTTLITEDTTLYAKWNVTVRFEVNGGFNIADKTVLSGSTITQPDNPTKAGATFVDWYTDSALTTAKDFGTPIITNTILYAKWISAWSMVAVGRYHTVGIQTDGKLWAWGNNTYGELGLGNKKSKTSPKQVAKGTTWTAVAAGKSHTVGIKADNTLWAWGYNRYGQLGLGDWNSKTSPQKVGTDTWKAVAAGYDHTVGIDENGTLWAWGSNNKGQLGLGTIKRHKSPQKVGIDTWLAVAAGEFHTVGIKADGTLWAWGYNDKGQLGLGINRSYNRHRRPQQVGKGTTWKAVAAGKQHTVGIKADGTLWAWGNNKYGQLGLGRNNTYNLPQQVAHTTTTWKAVAAGDYHTVGIQTDNTLWAWGYNNKGQLGLGDSKRSHTYKRPQKVGTGWSTVVDGGYGHTVSIDKDGKLWAWGYNDKGQLGLGDTNNRNSPSLIE